MLYTRLTKLCDRVVLTLFHILAVPVSIIGPDIRYLIAWFVSEHSLHYCD
jgi:hypothetical protein